MTDLKDYLSYLSGPEEVSAGPLCVKPSYTEDPLELFLTPPVPKITRDPSNPWVISQLLLEFLNQRRQYRYNSRSNFHSRVKCLGHLLDLLLDIPDLRQAMLEGRVVFGIETRVAGRDRDLAIGLPGAWCRERSPHTVGKLAKKLGVTLPEEERMRPLLDISEGCVESPIYVVEAKAIMTEHSKAKSRVFREARDLQRDFGETCVKAGLFLINTADEFVSSIRGVPQRHNQPHDTEVILNSLTSELCSEQGLDALGVVLVDCSNRDNASLSHYLANEYPYGQFLETLRPLLLEALRALGPGSQGKSGV